MRLVTSYFNSRPLHVTKNHNQKQYGTIIYAQRQIKLTKKEDMCCWWIDYHVE